jgi:hypothetical protein
VERVRVRGAFLKERRNSSAIVTDPALLERVKGIARQILGHRPVEVYLFGSWAHGTQRSTKRY